MIQFFSIVKEKILADSELNWILFDSFARACSGFLVVLCLWYFLPSQFLAEYGLALTFAYATQLISSFQLDKRVWVYDDNLMALKVSYKHLFFHFLTTCIVLVILPDPLSVETFVCISFYTVWQYPEFILRKQGLFEKSARIKTVIVLTALPLKITFLYVEQFFSCMVIFGVEGLILALLLFRLAMLECKKPCQKAVDCQTLQSPKRVDEFTIGIAGLLAYFSNNFVLLVSGYYFHPDQIAIFYFYSRFFEIALVFLSGVTNRQMYQMKGNSFTEELMTKVQLIYFGIWFVGACSICLAFSLQVWRGTANVFDLMVMGSLSVAGFVFIFSASRVNYLITKFYLREMLIQNAITLATLLSVFLAVLGLGFQLGIGYFCALFVFGRLLSGILVPSLTKAGRMFLVWQYGSLFRYVKRRFV